MIILVGSPGSGKSNFCKNYLADYTRINNDTLRSRDRCLKVLGESLSQGKSCVVDNTNPTREVRAYYINMAKRHSVPVRCINLKVDKPMAFHLDTLRLVNEFRSHITKRVGSMPIHKFFKDFERPRIDEGFIEVRDAEFIAGPFDNDDDRNMFFSYVYS